MTVPSSAGADVPAPELHADETQPADPHAGDGAAGQRSLFDDFEALIDDARTYFDAELSYQKTRAGFVTDRLKKTIGFGIGAAYFAILATIGLTVGLIIALTPHLTAWGATAVVFVALFLLAYLLVRKAGNAWKQMMGAMSPPPEETKDG